MIMKKFITIILGTSAVIAIFFVPATLFAATFNNDSRDFQTLRAGNYTKNPTTPSSAWTTSVNADGGDIVNMAVYYHNTGSDTARNVRVKLTPQTTSVSTSQVFLVTILADNSASVSGSATVLLSSSQSITFNGNVSWLPDQRQSGSQTLPSGQTGYELFSSSGLNIGDIASGWST